MCLLRTFNALARDYQAEQQRGQKSSRKVALAKVLAILVFVVLFLFNTVLYDLVGPLLWHFKAEQEYQDGAKRRETSGS